MVCGDTPLGGHVIEDGRDVTEPARMFASLQVAALGEAESLDLPRIISEEPAARIEEWERAC
ncbi:hypothetical protein GCM10027271_37950 [Saccharopolyspora gloriosae]|uniref:Uncharacterized protein n=1 Tax=Saccharopolyspora gloriosae TaxID=455344 RepID=A0A840NEB1_9PSEU|nr:hypothetical protein [Saccharopolyspora gloriosae]